VWLCYGYLRGVVMLWVFKGVVMLWVFKVCGYVMGILEVWLCYGYLRGVVMLWVFKGCCYPMGI
jgi:hypothetical protein